METRASERERRKVEEERKEGSGVTSTLDWNLKVAGSIPGFGTVEEERKEGSGVISALDWNLKVAGSIPGPTHREIIHPKTTIGQWNSAIFKTQEDTKYYHTE